MTVWQKIFGKYLLVTNTVSCGLMMAAGDVIQQRNEHWRKNNKYFSGGSYVMAALPEEESQDFKKVEVYRHDYVRTRNMMVVGLLQGPFHHWFYSILDKFFPGRCFPSVIKKTCLDQSIASPTCLGIFFIGLGVLEHRKLEEIYEEIRIKLYDTWKVDCCFWPPTQCVNFFFIPFQYRVLYTNFMTMIYDIFLSYIKYDAQY